jgi:signal transduction histidine kinase
VSVRLKLILALHAAVCLLLAALHVRAERFLPALLILALPAVVILGYHWCVARPLRHILEGARRIAGGDHRHRVGPMDCGEMVRIAEAIDTMAERAARAQQELERKVEERTKDLRAVLEEVHERSRIAEEVNAQLAEADRRKTDFLTNVSHELRTPLNSIIGFLRLIGDGLYESEQELEEFLRNARQSAEHLLQLVTDVLSAARLEAGREDVRLTTMHPADAICDALRLMDSQLRERGLEVGIEVDGDLMVVADEARLRQVLVNLLGNAAKFTAEGRVTVRARRDDDRGKARFEVEDTGEGIPAHELESIFEKFHKVDSPAAKHRGGTGLGLSISRKLVRLMGGDMGALSDGPGEGSLFHFTLPAVCDVPVPSRPFRIETDAHVEA